MATKYPPSISRLVSLFMRFEGVGRKTAERLTFNMLSHWDERALSEFIETLSSLKQKLHTCPTCRSFIEEVSCPFCSTERMREGTLCIVAQAKDVYIIESTDAFHGAYFVLGTLLSPLDGRGLRSDVIDTLLQTIDTHHIKEVLLALDSSLEGDATSGYLKDILSEKGVLVTKLASGIPMGVQLDFVDRGTLFEALRCRQRVQDFKALSK